MVRLRDPEGRIIITRDGRGEGKIEGGWEEVQEMRNSGGGYEKERGGGRCWPGNCIAMESVQSLRHYSAKR